MRTRVLALALAVALGSIASAARADDVVTPVRPGIEYLYREIKGPKAQKVHVTRVDLAQPTIGLHASRDAKSVEWKVDTKKFAEVTDTVVAINGDWSCVPKAACGDDFLRPMGLAISNGEAWNPHLETNAKVWGWGYFGCTVEKDCQMGVALPLDDASMFWSPLHAPTIAPLRFHNALGGSPAPLLQAGALGAGCSDGQNAPRTAICLEADRKHLRLFVVDGRDADLGEVGMTCDEVRAELLGLGCWDAMMLDGGGSSTMVVDGVVKNTPSDGSLRTVANHIGVTFRDVADPACAAPNGRWCEGTVLRTCEGGRVQPDVDCGARGFGCQVDGAFAFCVDPRCPGGDGLAHRCTDATKVEGCNDGNYGAGDCGFFGLVCGGPEGRQGCMDARCDAPDMARCEGSTSVTCVGGVYATIDCTTAGLPCDPATGTCREPDAPDAGVGGAGGAAPSGGGGTVGGAGGVGGASASPGVAASPTPHGEASGCGCRVPGRAPGPWAAELAGALVVGAAFGRRARRRR